MSATLPSRQAAEQKNKEYHWTADGFDRACDLGIFGPEARLELIHGRIVEKMGQSSFHANIVEYCADCLRAALTPRFRVREEKPLRLSFDGEPVPDITLVRGQLKDAHQPHPQPPDVALLVEVSVTSAEYDLGDKALLYAQAGIGDYWVVLPEAGEIVVHREPSPDGYQSVTRVGETGTVSPLAAPQAALRVHELLGRSEEGESP